MSKPSSKGLFVLDVDDPYIYDLVKDELSHYQSSWTLVEPRVAPLSTSLTPPPDLLSPETPPSSTLYHNTEEDTYNNHNKQQHTFYYTEYEKVDWDCIDFNPLFASSVWYTNRKGLIRKAELVNTIENHIERCDGAICDSNNSADCDEILDDENWYYMSDVDDDTDVSDDESASGNETSRSRNGDQTDEAGAGSDGDNASEDGSDEEAGDESDQASDTEDSEEKKFIPQVFKGAEGCCPLQSHVPHSIHFSIYSINELDELLLSELPEILTLDDFSHEENLNNCNMWILKPSLTNQAKGISLITSSQSFRDVFTGSHLSEQDRRDVLSIRDWVIQKYVHPPLLLNGRKFHLRVYVLASGSLNIYIFDRFLALFSLKDYPTRSQTSSTIDPSIHITNTCYQKRAFLPEDEQDQFNEEKCVMLFHEAVEQWANQYLSLIPPPPQLPQDDAAEIPTQSRGIPALRHTLRQLNALFASPDETDNEAGETNLPNAPSQFQTSYSLFLFFFKRVMKHYHGHPDLQSTHQPNSSISLIFNPSTQQVDFEQLSKQIAIQMYSHVLQQIKVILQELFMACVDYHGHRLQIEPPIQHENTLDLFTMNKIVDDRLDQDELQAKNEQLFQTAGALPLAQDDRRVQNVIKRSIMNNKYKPLPNCTELYGFDFIVDHRCKVFLMEANPGPDFGQTGIRLKSIVCKPLVAGLISILLQQKHFLVKQQFPNVAEGSPEMALINQTRELSHRDVPLGVQFLGGIVEQKETADSPAKDSAPVFLNVDQISRVYDYIGTTGETSWSTVMPTAPHFLPILHIPYGM